MLITANFTNKGVPQDGLTPTIRIVNIPDVVEVSGASMTEITDLSGTYFYDYNDYNLTGDYLIRCDGGAGLSNYDRYTWGTNRDDLEITTGINNISGAIVSIKEKTDYLPVDTSGEIAIVQGLLHSNIYTTTTWDGDLMTGSLVKLYDSSGNAVAHTISGLIASFQMTGTYVDGKIQTINMVRVS